MDKCGAFDCVSSSQTDDWLAIKSQIRNTQSVSIFPNQHTRIHSKSYLFNSQSHTYIETGEIFFVHFCLHIQALSFVAVLSVEFISSIQFYYLFAQMAEGDVKYCSTYAGERGIFGNQMAKIKHSYLQINRMNGMVSK